MRSHEVDYEIFGDDMQIVEALFSETARLIGRIIIVGGRLVHFTMEQPHAGAALKVDGRIERKRTVHHGRHVKNASMKSSPARWLFSG